MPSTSENVPNSSSNTPSGSESDHGNGSVTSPSSPTHGGSVRDLSNGSVPNVPISDLSLSNVSVSDLSLSVHHISLSVLDLSCDESIPISVPIVIDISNTIIHGVGYDIVKDHGLTQDGTDITRVTFDTTQPDLYDPIVHENLTQVIDTYNDEVDPSGQSVLLLNQISSYASQINCVDFHGKGSIDDYTVLFQAASRIATESKQMELDIDVDGFSEFAQAADDLSELFTGFISKLQNINIINDITFLQSIAHALEKIVNLSKIFGKFKETVFATSTIQFPKSSHDAAIIINNVMGEVNCAMNYINHFVSPEADPTLHDSQLSDAEKNIITQSVNTIESWNLLCEQGVSIAMANNTDVQYIQATSNDLKLKTTSLKHMTSTLKSKLASFNILC